MSKKIKVLSLFDGISCAQVALKSLGYEVEYYASEVDKYALETTKKNHPNTIQLGDVKGIDASPFASEQGIGIDLLIGGSPCQDLSISKKNREGLKGKRSGLFYEYLRILKEARPKYFVLENVASMPNAAKDEISKALGVEPIMINAALVSAQQRKRLFWTNIKGVELPEDRGIYLKDIIHELRGEPVDEKYYISDKALKNKKTVIKELTEKARALSANMRGVGNNGMTCIRVGSLGKGGQGERVYSVEGKSVALAANGGGGGAKTGLYLVTGCASRTYPRTKTPGVKRHKQLEVRKDGKANTITTVQSDSMVLVDARVRKLTPIECERLQSMPDNCTAKGINDKNEEVKMSDTQRYKMCGNAFNRLVVEHILSHMEV